MSINFASLIRIYHGSEHKLPFNCIKGIFVNFIESTLAGVFYFLSIYFVDVLHINISTAGIIVSMYGLGTILGGFIGGKLSDELSPLRVSTFSLFVQAIAMLLLIKINNIVFIACDLFILGTATYGFITSNYLWVLSYCNNSEVLRLNAINRLAVASNLGMGIAALIIGELATYSFQYVFYLSGVLFLFLAISLAFQIKNEHVDIKDLRQPENIQTNSSSDKYLSEKTGIITLVLICLFITGMIVSQLSTTYSIYLKNKFPHLGLHAFSFLFFLNTVLIVLFQNYFVNKFSETNKIMMIGIGSCLIGFGMMLLNFSFVFPIAILSCIIYSIGEMLFFSMVQLYCYQKGKQNKKGKSLGQYRMVYASSRFLGPTIGGAIYHYVSGNALWYCSGLVGFIFLITCYRYKSLA